MRLTSLKTKMKSILCISMLLCITAESVFGQSVELNGIVGNSMEFPTKVRTSGSLMYSDKTIGRVLSGKPIDLTDPEYEGRVKWDSSTGLFSVSGLKTEDSGVYKVEKSDEPKSVSTYSLTVWIPVSKPNITIPHNEYPCSILCTVNRGTGVTLTLYREGQKKRYISSDSLDAPYLKLPQALHKSGIYTCEARNSVSNETSDPLTVGPHCTDGAVGIWQAEGSKMWSLCLVLIVRLCSRLI